MKICMLTTGHSALDDRIYYKEALSLKEKYSDVTIIAPDDQLNYSVNGVNIIGIEKPKTLLDRYKLVDVLITEAAKQKADVYHFHDYEIVLKAAKLKKKVPNCKIIYDVHEHYPDMIRMSKKIPKALKPLAAKMVDFLEVKNSKKFDYIITADDVVKERFLSINKNTDVVYNFSEFVIQKNTIEEKKYDVIYQGGITMERGIFQVVKAIEIVKERFNSKVKMIFVGPISDKEVEDIVLPYVKEKGLEENISFLGKVPHVEVERYIRQSRMGVVTLLPYPKYFKNVPIKQFEYMSCGIPVIGSNLPPIEKFVTKYDSGIIVDPEKQEEIATAIIKLLEDKELCVRLGENGVYAVENEFNWSKMHTKLLEIYSKI